MKRIPRPSFTNATLLTPSELNSIHFGGIHSQVDRRAPDAAPAQAIPHQEPDHAPDSP